MYLGTDFALKPYPEHRDDVMRQKLNILITEANSHVREFLKRELTAEGISVQLAENAKEMLKKLYATHPLDVLIIDPDLPDMEPPAVLAELNERIPRMPVVFHAFSVDFPQYMGIVNNAIFVEKQGSSVERLKQVLSDIQDQKKMTFDTR